MIKKENREMTVEKAFEILHKLQPELQYEPGKTLQTLDLLYLLAELYFSEEGSAWEQ